MGTMIQNALLSSNVSDAPVCSQLMTVQLLPCQGDSGAEKECLHLYNEMSVSFCVVIACLKAATEQQQAWFLPSG